MLKSKKHLKLVSILSAGLTLGIVAFWWLLGSVWTQWDYQALDFFYKKAIESDLGPRRSSNVVYLAINDETYDTFGETILDRGHMAKVCEALAELGPEAVAFDLVFPRPSKSAAPRS